MSYHYVYIDGQRVEWNVAAAYQRMRADFRKAFPKIDLRISSATRTDAEQKRIWYDRMVTSGDVRGRRVYETRWWNGKLWYRISSAGSVAPPRTSNHEENGPNGPRSIDIRDTGSDYGVTRRGTRRDKWMEANAGKYGFENEGYRFKEPWHKTFRGKIGGKPSSGGGSTSGKVNAVTFYHREDKDARAKGRTVKPGQGFYLHTLAGQRTSQASNVLGGIGQYVLTAHVYAQGKPGDVVSLRYIWQDTNNSNPKTKNSPHYVERLTFDEDGLIRASISFQRGVARGYAVYLRLDTDAKNKGDVKVTVLDSDAVLL